MASLFDRYQKEKRQKKASNKHPSPRVSAPTKSNAGNGLVIERMSHEGRGIAHDQQGKTIFVEGALPGETVTAQITQSRSRYNEAHVIQVLKPATERVEPRCQHAHECGGCSMQHASHSAQIAHKQQVIKEHFYPLSTKHALDMDSLQAPALVATPFSYRRKARLSVTKTKSQGLVVGFRARGSKQIISIQECPILTERLQPLVPALQGFVPQLDGSADLGHIEFIDTETTAQVIIRIMKPLSTHDRELWRQFAQQHHVQIMFAISGKDSDAGLLYEPLQQGDILPMSYTLAVNKKDTLLQFQPGDFLQVNAQVNQAMVAQALAWLGLKQDENVLDLFCGFGNFTLPMAARCHSVLGVEGSRSQVEQANRNLALNSVANVRFTSADLNQPLHKFSWAANSFDVVVLDPPRAGAEYVCQHVSKLKPKRILYVSCDPATLARDSEILLSHGYRLQRWGMLDMFPQTAHMETMALFVPASDLNG
ncbi:23S rRNA (uracil(1939)-C(5))-methyltransferase RlmD [Aliidiomarina indica]|uniref:23S rRNA (uracil(1939)-C(5))-methyltransferase RlmD n=1 Tax=Aliidiomarina indica TaxID=2749147 RepID=UPI00188E4857|nr:23S rRNA (uracil(1939)-C(5))-methyltransferase RlmD [Aliidiomarina indica]